MKRKKWFSLQNTRRRGRRRQQQKQSYEERRRRLIQRKWCSKKYRTKGKKHHPNLLSPCTSLSIVEDVLHDVASSLNVRFFLFPISWRRRSFFFSLIPGVSCPSFSFHTFWRRRSHWSMNHARVLVSLFSWRIDFLAKRRRPSLVFVSLIRLCVCISSDLCRLGCNLDSPSQMQSLL